MSEQSLHPIVIYKGKKPAKQLRRLKKGRGKLVDKVAQSIDRIETAIGDDNKILVPIVIHYSYKKGAVASKGLSSMFSN